MNQGRVLVTELAHQFDTSQVTIRKDLEILHAHGLVHRTHGGALPSREGALEDPTLREKEKLNHQEKLRIAEGAAGKVKEGQVLARLDDTNVKASFHLAEAQLESARKSLEETRVRLLDEAFASRTLDEWRERLATLAGVWAPVQTARELHDDPQVTANGYLPQVDVGDGHSLDLVANPVQFDEAPPNLRRAPEHGEHTEEVLLELGVTWEEIAAYKESAAIL